jgi:dienelactone hydrolase
MMARLPAVLLAALLTACAALPTFEERRTHADALAAVHGWQASAISGGKFNLVAYAPRRYEHNVNLAIYIEGDGFAWVSPALPSTDPTPRDPLALRLALAHPQGNAVYLARPCQYVDALRTGCAKRYWMESRFAVAVVTATSEAIDVLKQRFGAERLTLVGYSGGGAVAALLATQRSDVERLVTVAGNLDHRAWTAHHRVAPLSASLNPVDGPNRLATVRQIHFIGELDRVIPPALTRGLPAEFLGPQSRNLHLIPAYDHVCCWAQDWPRRWLAAFPH